MNQFPAHFAAPLATVIAAFIAGGVAFLVAVLSKEQKISDFRQQWIEAIRNDIADLVGEYTMLNVVGERTRGKGLVHIDKAFDDRYANLVRTRSLMARIELRINPKEHANFIAALKGIQDSTFVVSDVTARERKIQAILDESRSFLKKEWRVVKRGERAFVTLKVITGGLATAAAISGVVLVYQNIPRAVEPIAGPASTSK
ncbi:hypothetical protein [Variovorax paradoxus]|uniref:hypothetical protein n=1 Tax=Variovorax paradoxus TaxID=34073 RepID=UPI00285427FB|nr:hypothetical protein [Variovorax paradoxus]MDR6453887.1 hypothetical protein [Variovorax paradoxus]